MSLQLFRGCLAVVGHQVDDLAQQVETETYAFAPTTTPYHITVVSKDELRSLKDLPNSADALQIAQSALGGANAHFYALGLGGNPSERPTILFVVIVWVKGQQIRKLLGLPPKDFHITLSQQDAHDIDKSFNSLLHDFPFDPSPELLDHFVLTLHMTNDSTRAKEFAIQLCTRTPTSEKGFLRLGDVALKIKEHKLAMLSYACAFHRADTELDTKVKEYCAKKIVICSKDTEWGTVCADWEVDQLPKEVLSNLLEPWSQELRDSVERANSGLPTLCRPSRETNLVPSGHGLDLIPLPRFFRWLVPFRIALMSTPRNAQDIRLLAKGHLGIRHILTLTEEGPLQEEWFRDGPVKNTFLPIPNYHPPTIEQMDLIVRMLDDSANIPMLIHCGGGKGRAGTVAACYIAAFGFARIPTDCIPAQPAMSSEEAIAALRVIRPGSLETEHQEAFVRKWCSAIWKRQSVFAEVVPEPPPHPLEVKGSIDSSSNLFIFVGLPGSGKSWLTRALLARDPQGWIVVSQDEAGSRAVCETAIGRKPKGRMILDRCNTSRDDRASWLSLASNWAVSPICVWFDYDADLCTYRAQNRPGHPTLPPGNRVRNAVDQMKKLFVAPSLDEGFAGVAHIKSFSAAEDLVRRLSPPITLLKFPRTPHHLNLGAATEDDIVHDCGPLWLAPGEVVIITEKVDGANMGFSLSADRTQIVVQNRSHYVNPASHAQFKKLGSWVSAHRDELYKVLDRDPYFAQRYILYGEWLAATHSVAYTKLPDWFVAFDLYDRSTKTWADRRTLASLLSDTTINTVPLLRESNVSPRDEELKEMVQQQSSFSDGRVEGVYVKFEHDGKVLSRGKVVRGDFIAGNEHWTRGPLQTNALAREE